MRRFALVCFSVLLIVAPTLIAAPMARQSQIKGRVTDSQGQPVSGAKVVFRNVTTGDNREAVTDQNGDFVIDNVDAGKYTLEMPTAQNVATSTTTLTVDVTPANIVTVTIQQAVNGQIQVLAETLPDKSTSSINTVFNDLQIELLPQPNALSRSGQYFAAYNLALLSDGVTSGYIFQDGTGPAVGGRPNTSNNYHVNGIDNNNQAVPGPLVTISNEATTDFSLMQGQDESQFGHSNGGQMNVILNEATNVWHGGVYGYFNNRQLNAVEPALRTQRDLRYDQNRFGGKAGGPLMTNSLFAFLNFEYIPLRSEQASLNPVLAPTRPGFLAAASVPGVSLSNLAVLANHLQVSQTPVATTTVGGVTVPLGIVNTGLRTSQDQFNGIANIDWHVSSISQLSLRYVHNDIGTDAFGFTLPSFRVPGHERALLGAINYSATPTGFLTFNLNAGYNRLDQKVGGGSFAFPGLATFPNVAIQGLGLGLGSNVPAGRTKTNMYQGGAVVDWRSGGNAFRFGIDARKLQSVFGNLASASGIFTFSSLQQFLFDLPPDAGGLRTFGGTSFIGDRLLLHPFVQDTIRISGVDVELGLGYEYATVPQSLKRQEGLAGLSVPGLITFKEPETQQWNWEPRIGLAWSPGRTVVRGGFGIVYDALNQNSSLLAPDMISRTISSRLTTPGFFATGGATVPVSGTGAVGAFAFDQKLPYIIRWNGSVSHNLFGRLAAEVKYTGHHGVNLPLQSSLTTSPITAATSLPVFFTNPGPATLNSLGLTQAGLAATPSSFTTNGFTNTIFTVRPDGNSWYNAASLKLSETFTAGTQIAAEYTYQDAKANATGLPLDLAFGKRMEQVPWNQKHRATITPVVDIASMLPTSSGVVREIVANLSIMGTVTYARAPRIPLVSAVDTGMMATGIGSGVFVNPNGIGGTGTGLVPLTNSTGQTVAFVAADPKAQFVTGAPGTFSTTRPTIALGDTRNVDLAIVKRFTIPDRAKIELRGDAYNLFNHPQFTGMPISTLGTGLHVAPSFLLPGSIAFNNIRSGGLSANPRTVQLALRVLF